MKWNYLKIIYRRLYKIFFINIRYYFKIYHIRDFKNMGLILKNNSFTYILYLSIFLK